MSASSKKKARKLQAAEAQKPEVKGKKKMSKSAKETILVICLVVVVLAALAVTMIVYNNQKSKPDYDVDVPAGTVGTEEVSVPMMNYFYMDAVQNFYNNYGSFISYLLDTSKPLNEQEYSNMFGDGESYATWDDYFIAAAKDSAGDTYALYNAAVAAGYTLSSEDSDAIDAQIDTMEENVVNNGFKNADEYLSTIYGPGCDTDSYREFMKVQTIAADYYTAEIDKITVSDDEITAAYAADPSAYDRVSFSIFTASAPVTYDDDGNAIDPTEEEVAAKKQEAADMKDNFDDSKATVQTALTKSTVSGSYTEDVANWLFADSRKAGDVDLFAGSTDNVTYVVKFNERDDLDYATADIQLLKINVDSKEPEEGTKSAQERFAEIWDKFSADPTEENLAALIKEYSEDSSAASDNGVKTGVNKQTYASMSEMSSWLFNAKQEAGAYQKFENDTYGYYIVRFNQYGENFRHQNVGANLTNEKQGEWYESIAHSVEFVVDDAQIAHMRTGITLDNYFSSAE